jgi:hypothetical protein
MTTLNYTPPIAKSETRQIKRITRRRSTAKRIATNPKTNKPLTPDIQNATHFQTKATKVLQVKKPPKVDDIPVRCHKAMAKIELQGQSKLSDSLRKK